ncbi:MULTISPECIES: efflux RND transporter periplasmic adaptor subunit [Rhodanobacter]|uniref:efflux RND transporter periplasmic adaptor subunit n=1 Tax=Rhodanobacter TaxID=75309 RepID=UPI0003F99691|nr:MULTISPECIES: efflux RND transporter periplasmic adaptor subunit [Rhodanobacter]KZC18942.1 efflux transporter periplasmic adaptor subunit [Rhodanobacter denitrificans]UJM95093.1 efflux RND transporter periplasmic adaptor subunit [Rhodanobacter denitrificans]UJM98624.1 efflux RND transporter periplasmic adaptor subunit [Rhodanobacter denitrificans]UJN21961.1 efflux RND transporter periplasmic adaptor subunit [Rhodanobacter denitrificans]
MKRLLIILAAIVAAAGLLVAGYLGGRHRAPTAPAQVHPSPAAPEPAGKVLYWYDPMAPEQHFDRPGLSPMGMQMVPRYADANAAGAFVRIDPATVQNLGVRTAPVERRVLSTTLRVPGTVAWNPREATTVSARVDAVIARLQVRAPYAQVAAGQPLAELLAPQWSSALAEYDALQGARSADAKALRGAARERLQVLGLTAVDIRAVRRGAGAAIALYAPQAGVVTTLEVREGQRVSAGQTLLTLNGLATVWVEAAVPQALAGAVRGGTPVTVTVDALPGQVFHGSVEALLPDIDSATRTRRARIVLANPGDRLSPGMFVTVQLHPADGVAVPVVPDDALIATGQQTRVIVAEAGGRFRPLAVRTGRSADGYTEILAGLHGGEKIVVSGQFLIDSEASLSGALERLGDGREAPAAATSAANHAMSHPMPTGDKR